MFLPGTRNPTVKEGTLCYTPRPENERVGARRKYPNRWTSLEGTLPHLVGRGWDPFGLSCFRAMTRKSVYQRTPNPRRKE